MKKVFTNISQSEIDGIELWQEQQRKKPTRDMAEVEELGCMSSEHFQEFLGFCLATLKSKTGGK